MALSFDDRISIVHYQMSDSERRRKFLIKVKAPQDWSEITIIGIYYPKTRRAYLNKKVNLGVDVDIYRVWLAGFVNSNMTSEYILEELYKQSDSPTQRTRQRKSRNQR